MNEKKIRHLGAGLLAAVWLGLALAAWIHPAQAVSQAERRKLAQKPALSGEALLSGSYMEAFETYSQDQFPLREGFRQLKSRFLYQVLRQKDNHGIYLSQGYAAKLEYPLNEASLRNAAEKLNKIQETYLSGTGCAVYLSIVPDKSYYLSQGEYPAMDYEALFARLREETPWAEYVDITECLTFEDYYRTDTHWRQERLLPVAQALCRAMGSEAPGAEDFTATALDRPFYGVYRGQAALPLAAETLYILESGLLDGCTVFNYETGQESRVYDMDKLDSPDLYDVYLSGAAALLTIENPQAASDRELIVFRDSFGSSLVPLLVQGYRTVTLVDIRYIATDLVGQFVDFQDQDVLFLYSTLVLNNSATWK